MSVHTLLLLAINRLPVLRPAEKIALSDVVGSLEFYRSLDHRSLGTVIGRAIRESAIKPDDTLRAAERDLAFCIQREVAVIPFWDERYPALLREIYDPPFMLFVRGTLPSGDRPAIAVVGTREPTAEAAVAAQRLAEEIADSGCLVVSGLARGIDAAAHRGALRSSAPTAGSTGAVLGCGIDRVYPASNRSLAADILRLGGFLASEYSPGVGVAKYHFPARNRIISGLSRGVVVVQAPARSGALITADYALDHGRDLFVHAAGIRGTAGVGSGDLAEDGARIVNSAADIFDEWGLAGSGAAYRGTATGSAAERATAGDEAGAMLAGSVRAELSRMHRDE